MKIEVTDLVEGTPVEIDVSTILFTANREYLDEHLIVCADKDKTVSIEVSEYDQNRAIQAYQEHIHNKIYGDSNNE